MALTDYNYLSLAVDNLVTLLSGLTDADNQPLARTVQKYLYPQPSAYPFMCLYPGGAQGLGRNERAGTDYALQTFGVIGRYVIGKVNDQFDGYQMGKLWLYLPMMLNAINEHPDLRASADVSPVAALSPDGGEALEATRLGVFRDDPIHLGFEISITLPFHIEREEIYYGE